MDAAVRVIARDGLAAASVRAIVAEAGMPLGAMHYAFESREELISAVISETAKREQVAILGELDQHVDGGLTELFRVGLSTFLNLLEADPNRELAVLELSVHGVRHDPEVVAERWRDYFEIASQALEQGAELCQMRWTQPTDQIAQALISAMDGLTLTWLMTRDSAAARRQIDLLAATFAGLAVPVAR